MHGRGLPTLHSADHAPHMSSEATAEEQHVRCETRGSLAFVTLARPKALNALTLGMVRALRPALDQCAADERVKCIVLAGEGGRAFCAGGDVRAVCEAAQAGGSSLPDAFFREEYVLNHAIATSSTPQVSVWDGIVMGGGAGLSVHGRFRVASEKALFAMPETGIGLFPDVGGSFFLSRLPGELGTYVGLTGDRLKAAELLYCGLATHYAPSSALSFASTAHGLGGPAAADDDVRRRDSILTPRRLVPRDSDAAARWPARGAWHGARPRTRRSRRGPRRVRWSARREATRCRDPR